MTMSLARALVWMLASRFAAHGCPVDTRTEELMARVLVEDTSRARSTFVCAAVAPNVSMCGLLWLDRCTLMRPY